MFGGRKGRKGKAGQDKKPREKSSGSSGNDLAGMFGLDMAMPGIKSINK